MPEKESRLKFPFTVRDMLAFEHGAAFSLRIKSQSTIAQTVIIRGMTAEGLFAFKHIMTADSTITEQVFRITDVPVWVSVTDYDEVLHQGEAYISLNIEINGDTLYELCAGLVYWGKSISWPTSNSQDKRPGGGRITSVTSANPAAGAEASITVPDGQIWRLIATQITLVTSATVANRRVHIVPILDSAQEIHCISPIDQAASLSRQYSAAFYAVPAVNSDDNDILVNLPQNILLKAGETIDTQTVNLQTGDDFSAMKVLAEIFFDTY